MELVQLVTTVHIQLEELILVKLVQDALLVLILLEFVHLAMLAMDL